MSACNCCEFFPTNVATLQSRSEFVSLGKCGYVDDDGNFNLVQTDSYENQFASDFWRELYPGYALPEVIKIIATTNQETCEETITFDPEEQRDEEGQPQGPYDDGKTYNNQISEAFSDPFTNNALKTKTSALITGTYGEWVNASSVTPQANRFFSTAFSYWADFSDYTITNTKVRIVHPPTATGYLKVWLVKRIFLYSNDEWVFQREEPFDVYEWEGEPSSAIHSINAEENQVLGDEFDAEVEADQFRYDIYIQKWSLIPDYEPADPAWNDELEQANKYERASPDCESNGAPTLNEECPFRE
jgi:hypothetical protein